MRKINTDKLRKNWPILLAIIVALVIAYYAYQKLQPVVYEKEAFVQSLVATSDIKPFTKITASDLGTKRVLISSQSKEAIQNPDEIIGKVANTAIKAGGAIYAKQLDSLEKHKNKQFITVSVDLSRSVGGTLRPGDIVDAYWIDSIDNQMWRKVGNNLTVVGTLDSSGNPVKVVADATGVGVATVAPTMVELAVDKEYINPLIGAATDDIRLVLVKKLAKDDDYIIDAIPVGGEGNASEEKQTTGTAGTIRH